MCPEAVASLLYPTSAYERFRRNALLLERAEKTCLHILYLKGPAIQGEKGAETNAWHLLDVCFMLFVIGHAASSHTEQPAIR